MTQSNIDTDEILAQGTIVSVNGGTNNGIILRRYSFPDQYEIRIFDGMRHIGDIVTDNFIVSDKQTY